MLALTLVVSCCVVTMMDAGTLFFSVVVSQESIGFRDFLILSILEQVEKGIFSLAKAWAQLAWLPV